MIELLKTIITSPYLGFAAICLSVSTFIFQLIVTEKYKAELIRENNNLLEEFRWDFKVREQAAKVADYLDLARNLKENSPEIDYHKANTLAWELAMWLPADIYKKLGRSLIKPSVENSPLDVVIEIRKILLREKAGDLTSDNVIHHAPGINKKSQDKNE